MKNRKISELEEIPNFSDICEPIIKYVRKHWNWKGLKPKNYKKYIENYQDYQDMEDPHPSEKTFDGLIDDISAMSFPIHVRLSIPHIAYDDTNQGRDPLHVLISSCISYGMQIEAQRHKLEPVSTRSTWKCPECGDTRKVSADTLAIVGTPHCSYCEEVEMLIEDGGN